MTQGSMSPHQVEDLKVRIAPETTLSSFIINLNVRLLYLVGAIDRVVVPDPSAHAPLHVQAVVFWVGIPYL